MWSTKSLNTIFVIDKKKLFWKFVIILVNPKTLSFIKFKICFSGTYFQENKQFYASVFTIHFGLTCIRLCLLCFLYIKSVCITPEVQIDICKLCCN